MTRIHLLLQMSRFRATRYMLSLLRTGIESYHQWAVELLINQVFTAFDLNAYQKS